MIWCSPPRGSLQLGHLRPVLDRGAGLKMPVSLDAITGMGVESQYNSASD